jgi:hypothetical protein
MKMEHENETKNDPFCKIEGMLDFSKKHHFHVHFCLILTKMRVKMSQKWPKNAYREQP